MSRSPSAARRSRAPRPFRAEPEREEAARPEPPPTFPPPFPPAGEPRIARVTDACTYRPAVGRIALVDGPHRVEGWYRGRLPDGPIALAEADIEFLPPEAPIDLSAFEGIPLLGEERKESAS